MKPLLRDPSFIGALVHFERVAARGGFTQAAADLGVTTSAVSHRVRRLEQAIGHRLFERRGDGVALTEAGETLHTAVGGALARIGGAVETLTGSRTLRLSIGPYLSTAWLMPRLGAFEAENPALSVDLVHRIGPAKPKDADIAVIWSDDETAPPGAERLFAPEMIPVAAPGVARPGPVWESRLPPLHYRSRKPWSVWLDHAGGPRGYAARGEIFDDPNIVLEAAAHRRGIALGFAPFHLGLLQSCRLEALGDVAVRAPESYWLVVQDPADTDAGTLAAWLRDAARDASRWGASDP
jgi:LysR family glycine cleavage system transcriptional activator